MSQSQEEFVLKFGIDNSKLERDLREAERIGKQYANKQGAAMSMGGMNGSMPQSWSSMGNLAQQSQNFIKGMEGGGSKGGLMGMADNLKNFVSKMPYATAAFAVLVGAVKAMHGAMEEAFDLGRWANNLGTTSKFMLDLGKAAKSVGSNMEEAAGRLVRFESLIGQASSGSKEALEALNKLGITPWGKTMEETISAAAEAFRKIEDPAKRARLATEMFGRGGIEMVEVLGKLAEKRKNGGGWVTQSDLDTLEAGGKKWKSFWASVWGGAKDLTKIATADFLRFYGIVKNPPERTAERIGRPEKSAEQKQKEANDLAKAEKEYLDAVDESGTKAQQLASRQEALVVIHERIKGTLREIGELQLKGEDTTEKQIELLKLQTERVKEQQKVAELQKGIKDHEAETQRKLLEYGKEYYNLTVQQYRAERAVDEAKSDRSGWTPGDIRNANPNDARNAIRRFRNRPQTPTTGNPFVDNYNMAGDIQNAEAAAKAMRLLGVKPQTFSMNTTFDENGIGRGKLGGPATFTVDPTERALSLRKKMDALTSGEQDPMRGVFERLEDLNKNMAELLQKAKGDGIKIIPINGK